MEIKISANEEIFAKAKEKLSASQIASAMRMAINDSLRNGRVMVRRSVQEEYNIRANVLNDANPKKGISVKLATNSSLTGQIKAGHTPMSITHASPQFKQGADIATRVKFTKAGKAQKGQTIRRSSSVVSIEVIKGKRKTIASAFTIGRGTNALSSHQFATSAIFAKGKRGKPGFQFSKKRMPIDTLSTVSVGTATTNKRTLAKYDEPINAYAKDRFVHHVERLIKAVDGIS